MLGVLQLDIDRCIEKYIDLARELFPVEGVILGMPLWESLHGASNLNRLKRQSKIWSQINSRQDLQKVRTKLLKFEAAMAQQCRVLVQNLKSSFHYLTECVWRLKSSGNIFNCKVTIVPKTSSMIVPSRKLVGPPLPRRHSFCPLKSGHLQLHGGLCYKNPIRALMVISGPIRKLGAWLSARDWCSCK